MRRSFDSLRSLRMTTLVVNGTINTNLYILGLGGYINHKKVENFCIFLKIILAKWETFRYNISAWVCAHDIITPHTR